MGRKPNQLILEFFIRGQKLEDNSNRYQHTCKACGEKFPKGRVDSLTNHLVKKCQAIPLRDRQRVLLRLHELPDLADSEQKDANVPEASKGKPGQITFSAKQNFDGLNVLAEASRQVGASDRTKRRQAYTQSTTAEGKSVVVDPALEAESFQGNAAKPENGDENNANPSGESSICPYACRWRACSLLHVLMIGTPQNANSPAGSPKANANDPQGGNPPAPPTTLGDSPDTAANANQSQLSMIAASASEMVPQGLATDQDPASDGKGGGAWNQQLPTQEQLLFDSLQEHDPTLTSSQQTAQPQATPQTPIQRAANFPRPIAMDPSANSNIQAKGFVNEFGNSTKPVKPKVRGRFSATRRREVQQVRKRGACIRCRMLKKPV